MVYSDEYFKYIIDNPELWKKTSIKKYNAYASIPPIGTDIYNKLDGITYKTTTSYPVVLTGTTGEKIVISLKQLITGYVTIEGKTINEQYIKDLYTKAKINNKNVTVVKPFRICNIPDNKNLMATFVSSDIQFRIGDTVVNADNIDHGVGDFIVCDVVDGPDFNSIRCINGAIFPNMYNMRNFPNIKYKIDRLKGRKSVKPVFNEFSNTVFM